MIDLLSQNCKLALKRRVPGPAAAPDLAWIAAMFEFQSDVGNGSGIMRLMPTVDGKWKALVYTNLESLNAFPESGSLRNSKPSHGLWEEKRRRERVFEDADPTVIIIGAGQRVGGCGKVKHLDVSSVRVKRNARLGDNWRNRYEALCLHDPAWYDHMPYLPFPPTRPIYAPAAKIGN